MRVSETLAKSKHMHNREYLCARIMVRCRLDPVRKKSANMRVSLVEAMQRTRPNEPFYLSIAKHLIKRRSLGRGSHIDIIRQRDSDLFRPTGRMHAPTHPFDVRRCHAIIFENAPCPDISRQLPFRDADATAFEIRGAFNAFVGTNVDRRMAKSS